jgi:pantoate--beta-alanine ligase
MKTSIPIRAISIRISRLLSAKVDLVYTPSEDQLYPDGPKVITPAGEAAKGLESDFRPHFFDGVATVVKTLFDQVRPDVAVFGEKDFQQLQVIREMVAAHNLPIEILGGPIVRDDQGLALSSRNAYLSPEELEIARMLNQILYHCALQISSLRAAGEAIHSQGKDGLLRPSDAVLAMTEEAKTSLLTCGFDKVDYVSERWGRVLGAAWLGKTRLIDNAPI